MTEEIFSFLLNIPSILKWYSFSFPNFSNNNISSSSIFNWSPKSSISFDVGTYLLKFENSSKYW